MIENKLILEKAINKIFDFEKNELEYEELKRYELNLFRVLSTIGHRQMEVFIYREIYGKTLEECGKFLGVKRERIRQIEAKTFRMLRHPTRIKIVRGIEEIDHYFRFKNYKETQKNHELRNKKKLPERTMNEEIENLTDELPIRVLNCFKRCNIKTLEDLINKTDSELMGVTNFGRRSLHEVIEFLSERGLSLYNLPPV
jgi:hypothetical protein